MSYIHKLFFFASHFSFFPKAFNLELKYYLVLGKNFVVEKVS